MTGERNPFQSPALPDSDSDSDSSGDGSPPPFVSGWFRAALVICALTAIVLFDMAFIGLNGYRYSLLNRRAQGERLDRGALRANSELAGKLSWPTVFVHLGAVVAFLFWLHRAYRNLRALGNAAPATTPAVAVALYFVPLVNLFMPCAVMAEIWRYSDPVRSGSARRSVSRLVPWWWIIFVASRLPFVVSVTAAIGGPIHPSIDQVTSDSLWALAAAAGELISAVLTILLVWRIDRNQSAAHALIESGSEADAASGRTGP